MISFKTIQTNEASAIPVIVGGDSSSQFQSSSSSQQSENVAPIVIPVGSGGSESYSSHSESSSSHSNPTVITQTIYPSGSSEVSKSYSEKVVSSGSSAPIITTYPAVGGSEHYSHSRISESSGGVPLAPYPVYQPQSSGSFSSHHSERISQAAPVAIPIYPSVGSNSHFSSSQVSEIIRC